MKAGRHGRRLKCSTTADGLIRIHYVSCRVTKTLTLPSLVLYRNGRKEAAVQPMQIL